MRTIYRHAAPLFASALLFAVAAPARAEFPEKPVE
jgi:hypothetical protein